MRPLNQLINLIKYSPVTEKTVKLNNQFVNVFVVDRSLTKGEIKSVIENIFKVNVEYVNTCTLPPKTKRVRKFLGQKSKFKKAFVKLQSQSETLKADSII